MKQRIITLLKGVFIFIMSLAAILVFWGALSGFFLLVIRGCTPDMAMYNPVSILTGIGGGIFAVVTLSGVSEK